MSGAHGRRNSTDNSPGPEQFGDHPGIAVGCLAALAFGLSLTGEVVPLFAVVQSGHS